MCLFEVKVAYGRQTEDAVMKKVSEIYLIMASSFAEAEERAQVELGPLVSIGILEIGGIKEVKYEKILRRDRDIITLRLGHNYQTGKSSALVSDSTGGSRYYNAKLEAVVINNDTGLERKVKSRVLIEAGDFDEAYERLGEYVADESSYGWRATSLEETQIMDIIDRGEDEL